jgi:hypothetical protein
MSEHWYYAQNGQRVGPITLAGLQQLVVSGRLGPMDMVQGAAQPHWLSARDVPGLFPQPAPPVPPPTQPAAIPAATPPVAASSPSKAPWHHLSHGLWLLVVGLGLGALKWWGCLPEDWRTPWDPNPAARITREVANANPVPITAYDLEREYRANEVVANERYQGKVLEVTGTITLIQGGDSGLFAPKPCLYLGGIQCVFRDESALKQVATGQLLSVRGKCTGRRRIDYCSVRK